MSFKQLIPDLESEWDSYWEKTSMANELELVETDGLRPIFERVISKNDRILESGCGLGKWIVHFSKAGYNIEGVDANELALKKLKDHYPQSKVKIADVRSLPYDEGSFDVYLSLGVVEHFEEGPKKALDEAYRVLKKGGTAIIEVPFDSPLRKLTRLLTRTILVIKTPARLVLEFLGVRKKRAKIKTKFYEYRYERKELENVLKDVGFSEIKIFPKDDLSEERSIALWLDYPSLRKESKETFRLNKKGMWFKRVLETISPFSYCALLAAVCIKKDNNLKKFRQKLQKM